MKSSFQTGNSIHFPVVLLRRKIRLTAVFLGGRCGSFPHWGIALNAPANHGTITAEKCGKQSKPDGFASSLKEGASGAPQALHFSRKLFRTAKGPIPEDDFPRPGEDVAQRQKGESVERSETGGVCSRRAREQQLFPVWKTACFPAFSTRKNGSGPVLKTCDRCIPDWRKINRRSGTVCRMQRKSFDFLFYKRQNARIFAQNYQKAAA